MPFAENYLEVYQEVYKPVCAASGIDCWRVDEISRPGSITRDIVEGILDADIVIADLTGKNANVFYELGIAHSVGNKTIMTAQNREDVPFDIANYRVLFYEQTIKGSKQLFLDLDKAIKELMAALDRTNNPLQEALSNRNFIGARKKAALAKYVDMGNLTSNMRRWLQDNDIIYADDVARIDIRKLPGTPGLGQDSISRFLAAILEHDLHPDAKAIQEIIVKHNYRLRPRY